MGPVTKPWMLLRTQHLRYYLALDCKTQQIVTLKDKQRLRHDVGNKTPPLLTTIITKSRSTLSIDINWYLL